jgi:D-alanyl-D-alanine dipeptidase
MISSVSRFFRLYLVLPFLILASFLPASIVPQAQTAAPVSDSLLPGAKPPDVPEKWKQLVGIYEHDKDTFTILERKAHLIWRYRENEWTLNQASNGSFYVFEEHGLEAGLSPKREESGRVSQIQVHSRGSVQNGSMVARIAGENTYLRADAGADPSNFYHVTPAQPVAELREKALKLLPPAEPGPFRKADLVELATLDSAIHLDIRYASTNNFLSTPVYTESRAFMQRPAAEALVRVLHKLQPLGYGLLIHDAYRPWYVTKIFWDATPPEGKIFVADPQKGSKHNRGCAVDLTLYDIATGQPVEMPGLYDEMSPRSFPNFPGGTSLQRWHRDLLRRAMESEGFTVNEDEWWHFDYKDWKQYGILNVPFEKIVVSGQPVAVSH